MFSSDGEGVPFSEEMYPRGNVEDWLLEVERVMQASLKSILHRAIVAYEQVGDWCWDVDGQWINKRLSLLDF